MADRLADLEERIDSIEQLHSVVSAYRGIAAARLRDAQKRLEGVRSYADTVGDAIGEALGLMLDGVESAPTEPQEGAHLMIVLCSEQGFVANFNSRILDEAERLIDLDRAADRVLFIVGDRGLLLARERNLAVDWSVPMAAHADEVTALANRLADALYERLEQGRVGRASILHAALGQDDVQIVTKSLIPFDFSRFPSVLSPVAPLTSLPTQELVARLAEEYVFAELYEAAMLSFAAENQTRMLAMVSARTNVKRRLDELTADARRVRQEEITAEVTELAAGSLN